MENLNNIEEFINKSFNLNFESDSKNLYDALILSKKCIIELQVDIKEKDKVISKYGNHFDYKEKQLSEKYSEIKELKKENEHQRIKINREISDRGKLVIENQELKRQNEILKIKDKLVDKKHFEINFLKETVIGFYDFNNKRNEEKILKQEKFIKKQANKIKNLKRRMKDKYLKQNPLKNINIQDLLQGFKFKDDFKNHIHFYDDHKRNNLSYLNRFYKENRKNHSELYI